MKIAVLGGGIIGITTAYYLARQGLEVEVLERETAPATQTSFANAGLLVPSQAPPWNASGMPLQALRGLFSAEGPLVLRRRFDPPCWLWLARFVWHAAPARHLANTRATLVLATYSRGCLHRLRDEAELSYDATTKGILSIVRDPADLSAAERGVEQFNGLGIPAKLLDAEDCVALEPALAPIRDQILAAVHTVEDESGDAHEFACQLAQLARDIGVQFRFGCDIEDIRRTGRRVTEITTSRGSVTADAYVLALGNENRRMARPLGIRLPIYPVKGYSVTLPSGAFSVAPSMPVRDGKLKVAITPLGDRIRIAGIAELGSRRDAVDPRLPERLRSSLFEVFPAFRPQETGETWMGARPMTPDGPPILGPTPYDNLYLNCGHGALGWTLACGSGRVVADLIAGRRPGIDLAGLTLGRTPR